MSSKSSISSRPFFKNRQDAGRQLALKLEKYNSSAIIFALPRGGVPVAAEIARHLKAPLDLLFVRKIGHPLHPEYAIGAVAEDGTFAGNKTELDNLDKGWLSQEVGRELSEIVRRRKSYLGNKSSVSVKDKNVIIVDDGIATGFTMIAAARMLRARKPSRLIIAAPVMPADTSEILRAESDEVITLCADRQYLGAVGAYYDEFPQLSDEEVKVFIS